MALDCHSHFSFPILFWDGRLFRSYGDPEQERTSWAINIVPLRGDGTFTSVNDDQNSSSDTVKTVIHGGKADPDRLSIGNSRLAELSRSPARPAHHAAKPSHRAAKPGRRAAKPTRRAAKPSHRTAKPSHGSAEPSHRAARPGQLVRTSACAVTTGGDYRPKLSHHDSMLTHHLASQVRCHAKQARPVAMPVYHFVIATLRSSRAHKADRVTVTANQLIAIGTYVLSGASLTFTTIKENPDGHKTN